MDMTAPAPRAEILYFATRSWEDPVWTSSQQIALALSRLARVLVVDPPLGPRAWRGRRRREETDRQSDTLSVLRPLSPVPFSSRFGAADRLARPFLAARVRAALSRLGFGDYQTWVISPRHFRLAEGLRRKILVYKCDGEVSTFPWLGAGRSRLVREEERLLRAASVVFCTSPSIAERKAAVNPDTRLVRLGVDAALYARVIDSDIPIPDGLRDIPVPRIGYVGALDAYKVDFELIRAVAASRPGWHWVLIGGTGVSDGTSAGRLPRLPNLHYLGVRPREEVPRYLKHCSVLAIPYRKNDYTANLTTLKMHEYLATGKPVVAVDLPHFRRLMPWIRLAAGNEEFSAAIAEALGERDPSRALRRRAIAEEESWEKQAERMLEFIRSIEEQRIERS
jgi:glycosyltransferase involved in cell wall biosynthesis